jgi:hypothetical protein
MSRAGILLVALLWACTSFADRPGHGPWEPVAYVGFVESIDRLAGEGAIDCGMHDFVEKQLTWSEKRAAYGCVQHALRTGVPFKYGSQRVPIDSIATEVVVRTPDSALWLITHDRMLGEEAQQQWNQTCRTVQVDRRTMIISRVDCIMKSEGILKFQ